MGYMELTFLDEMTAMILERKGVLQHGVMLRGVCEDYALRRY